MRELYRQYMQHHTAPWNRRLHGIFFLLGVTEVVLAIALGNPWLLLLILPTWILPLIGHKLVENNRGATIAMVRERGFDLGTIIKAHIVDVGCLFVMAAELFGIRLDRGTGADRSDAATDEGATPAERPATPQHIFDSVAGYYDTLNSVLSLGFDRRWRHRTAKQLDLADDAKVLDVATGTGALARAIHRRAPTARIVGVDVNENMLEVAEKKRRTDRMSFEVCSAEQLHFGDEQFDAVTMAMAIDDLRDKHKGASEMLRVLKPGGRVVVMELSQPLHPVLRAGYRLYIGLFPLIDKLLRRQSYGHLKEEIRTYRGREAVRELFVGLGCERYSRLELTGGVATVHIAHKPAAA